MKSKERLLSDVAEMILAEEYGNALSRHELAFDIRLILFGLLKVIDRWLF
jgi:hypothetical protein